MSSLTKLRQIAEGNAQPEQLDIETLTPARGKKRRSAKPTKTATDRQQIKPPQQSTGAKYSNPDFMQLKVYVRRKLKIAVSRKWEDEGGRDVSDLVDKLFQQYLGS